MKTVYLSLGTNLGDRISNLENAVFLLQKENDLQITRISSIYETEPWGIKEQNKFLNIVIELKTNLSAQDLLYKCNSIEKKLGRNREKEIRWKERTIDIDIIFYSNEIIETENLTIPHKFMAERAFVLVPLLEITQSFIHPVLNKDLESIYKELKTNEEVIFYGKLNDE